MTAVPECANGPRRNCFLVTGGTEGSNPSPSSGKSRANLDDQIGAFDRIMHIVARTANSAPRCGSAVFVEAEGFPGMALIMGGTLDDTSWLKPTMALFCDSAQPWLAISHEMKSFPRMHR